MKFIQILVVGVVLSSAVLGGSKTSPDIHAQSSKETVEVIVQFRQKPGDAHYARMSSRGATLKSKLGIVNAGVFSVPAGKVNEIGVDPDVLYVSPDREVAPTLEYVTPAVHADIAQQYGFSGAGVGVAIIDSGVSPHDDLSLKGNRSRIIYSETFTSGGTDDKFLHGTHVAGIVAGNGASTSGNLYTRTFRGVAPGANIINLKVLDSKGAGRDSLVIQAIERAIALKNTYNIRVINLSLGRPVYESFTQDPLCQAVEQAWKAGIVVVVAAGNEGRNNQFGNDGYGTITAPANDPLVITVGAMKTMGTANRGDDLVASYSSKGPSLFDHVVKPDLVAPGNRVISLAASRSTLATSHPENTVSWDYYRSSSADKESLVYYKLSGTSMAAPAVSGAVALLLEKDPALSPDQVKARLMRTATKNFPSFSVAVDSASGKTFRSQYDVFTVGAGYLDVTAALADTVTMPAGKTAASPLAVFDNASGMVFLVADYGLAGGSAALWGTGAVWGTGALWGSTTAWGMSSVWGTSVIMSGNSALWGSSALWGNSAVWGTNTVQGFGALWGSAALWGTGTTATGESLDVLIRGEN